MSWSLRASPVLAVLSLPLVGCSSSCSTSSAPAPVASTSSRPRAAAPPAAFAAAPLGGACLPLSFADLAARADASVAQVKVRQERETVSGRRRVVGEGLGSAFVYDSTGLILTNHHVIDGASDIRIVLSSGRELVATLVGSDPPTDIAVLRVPATDLPALALGDSDALRVGDWVVAIGNPFGLSHTVSAGIISAKGRTGRDLEGLGDGSEYFDFIQTDASINPGNSGGPLIDLSGRVVGINTAVRAQANNIGFAIPVNMVRELVPLLMSGAKLRRSALGLRVDPVTPAEAERLKLTGPGGAVVRAVEPGSAGDRAGLRENDVIVAFRGERITGPERLRWLASMAGVGKKVQLRVLRGERELELSVVLGALAERSPAVPSAAP